jgi:hypothetical protein
MNAGDHAPGAEGGRRLLPGEALVRAGGTRESQKEEDTPNDAEVHGTDQFKAERAVRGCLAGGFGAEEISHTLRAGNRLAAQIKGQSAKSGGLTRALALLELN